MNLILGTLFVCLQCLWIVSALPERMMKVAFLINAFLFAIFNAVILNFVGIITNMIIVIVTFSFLIKSTDQT